MASSAASLFLSQNTNHVVLAECRLEYLEFVKTYQRKGRSPVTKIHSELNCTIGSDVVIRRDNPKPDRQNPHSLQSRQVFWFLFWFDGDLIHFQTTILNRVEKADSPETIDSIDVLQ